MKDNILSQLSADYPWKEHIAWFPSIGSTNDHLKALAKQGAPHGTAIIAGHQSAGRGRLGRSFVSPEGMGVYLSFLIRPGCSATQLMHLTCAAAVAMCDAVEAACGITPGIKWTNDLVCGKHKLGGILTELNLAPGGLVDSAIVGIGINCRQQKEDFPPEIRDMAASLSMVSGKEVSPALLAGAMLEALRQMSDTLLTNKDTCLDRYRSHCVTLGQDISLVRGDDVRYGKALDIDSEGGLIVAFTDGTVGCVTSGEVSVRGMYGYV